MDIYFVRHGKAEPSSDTLTDEERILTQEGEKIVSQSVKKWSQFIESVDIIATSPLIRAVQTAEIIKSILKINSETLHHSSLKNGGQTGEILKLAEELSVKDLMLVGHQPDLSHHISNLVSRSGIEIKLKPAAIAKVRFDEKLKFKKGILEFLIPPVEE